MLINKCKILVALLLTFCIGFFINIDGVKADGDNTGYAQCYYLWEEEYHPTNRPSINADSQTVTGHVYRPYVIGINYYKDGSYKMWGDVACGERTGGGNAVNSVAASYSETKTGICNIEKYNEIFHVADLWKNYFVNIDGTWRCPSNIYINKENLNNSMSIYFTEDACKKAGGLGGCTRTVPLKEDRSQQGSGIPTALDLNGWDTDKKDVAGGGSSTHTTDPNNTAGSSIDIADIMAWGNKHSYDMDDLGSSCNIIQNNQIILAILKFIIWALAIAAIIILIIMTAADFVKAVTASDDVGLKKAFQHLVKRAIATVILIILPTIITFIINIINDNIPQAEGVVQLGKDGELYCGVIDSE